MLSAAFRQENMHSAPHTGFLSAIRFACVFALPLHCCSLSKLVVVGCIFSSVLQPS